MKFMPGSGLSFGGAVLCAVGIIECNVAMMLIGLVLGSLLV